MFCGFRFMAFSCANIQYLYSRFDLKSMDIGNPCNYFHAK